MIRGAHVQTDTHTHTFDRYSENTSILFSTKFSIFFLIRFSGKAVPIIHALTTSGNGPQLTYMYIKYPKYTPAIIYGTYVPQIKRLIYIMVNYYEHKFTEMKAHICIIVCYTKLAVLFCHFYRQFQMILQDCECIGNKCTCT